MGLFAVQDRYRLGGARRGQLGGARERPTRGGWLCEEGVAGQRAEVESRGREREKRGSLASSTRVFGMKTVYGKFFRKPFS